VGFENADDTVSSELLQQNSGFVLGPARSHQSISRFSIPEGSFRADSHTLLGGMGMFEWELGLDVALAMAGSFSPQGP